MGVMFGTGYTHTVSLLSRLVTMLLLYIAIFLPVFLLDHRIQDVSILLHNLILRINNRGDESQADWLLIHIELVVCVKGREKFYGRLRNALAQRVIRSLVWMHLGAGAVFAQFQYAILRLGS